MTAVHSKVFPNHIKTKEFKEDQKEKFSLETLRLTVINAVIKMIG